MVKTRKMDSNMNSYQCWKCRRRKVQTLALLAVIAALYFLLQFFSVSRLNMYHARRGSGSDTAAAPNDLSGRRTHSENVHDGKGAGDFLGHVVDKLKDSVVVPATRVNVGDKGNQHQPQDGQNQPVPQAIPVPRGVFPAMASQYVEDADGMFSCLESKQVRIPMEQVNDNFCDCPDSSDEPATNACPHARFYCQTQLPQREPQYVHSSKVNDGICDCCDGSDEWMSPEVPSTMRLRGQRGAVFHSPCTDRCGDIRQLMADEQRIRDQGRLLQQRYLQAASHLSSQEQQNYGPAGVFYLLSQQCYDHSTREYKYTVCPFQSVKQSSAGNTNTVLGRGTKWVQQKPGDYLVTMGNGDARLCPDGGARQTQIRFLCGLEDRVINVQENDKCRYFIKFSTPAAC